MLTKKTVLVLGAGASAPFGFPTGIQLSKMLAHQLKPGHAPFNHIIQNTSFDADAIEKFRDAFFESGKNSIDAFLEHRPEFMGIGKTTTATFLIPFETSEKLFDYDNNWLRYLYSRLSTTFTEFGKNRLSVITFNYDRTVEHFLFTSLKKSYGKDDRATIEVLNKILIIHLHGRLGYLPWEGPHDARPYENVVSADAIAIAARNIKIIHEDTSDGRNAEFDRAKGLLADADQIAFLGFGFYKTNIERLALKDLPADRTVATIIGLGHRETQSISDECNGKIRFVNADCYSLLREELDFS